MLSQPDKEQNQEQLKSLPRGLKLLLLKAEDMAQELLQTKNAL